ncbi:MarR family transcriptional regulator [Ruegeria sp. EL01]
MAQQLGMETSTMTPLVKRLEIVGCVTRTCSQTDRRAVDVTLKKPGC